MGKLQAIPNGAEGGLTTRMMRMTTMERLLIGHISEGMHPLETILGLRSLVSCSVRCHYRSVYERKSFAKRLFDLTICKRRALKFFKRTISRSQRRG
jgi:hypothetical protein